MELIGEEISVSDFEGASVCQRAFEASSDSKPLVMVRRGETLEKDISERVLKGLAKISLRHSDYDYSGLTQVQADALITDLSGDVEEFFQPILAKAENR